MASRLAQRLLSMRAAVFTAAALLALALAPAAGAHATLLATDPGDGAVLQRAPARVTLTFNEPVETAFGAVRVLDGRGKRVDDGRVTQPVGDSFAVGIGRKLPRGSYTVTWRVVSADSHPISGAFVFSVGAPSGGSGLALPTLAAPSTGSDTVQSVFAVVRFFNFALLLLVAGGTAALALVLGGAAADVRRRLLGVIAALAAALSLGSFAGILLEGVVSEGTGFTGAFRSATLSAVLQLRYGRVWLIEAIAAFLLALIAVAALRRRDVGAGVLACGWIVPALVVPPSAGAHAGVTGTVAFVADVAHVSAAAVWTGGLAFLALGLLLARAGRWELATRAVPRFSTLAVAAVGVLVVAGGVNGYLQVRSWSSLFGTTYGWLLLAKIGLVLPLVALGAYNNKLAVPRLKAGIASAFEQRRFLRAVGVELALMVTVIGVTAVLVAESPARGTIVVAPAGPYASTTAFGPLSLAVRVDPARSGSNVIDLRIYDRSGKPARVSVPTVAASLPSRKLGPLRFTAHELGPGHFAVHGADLTLAGKWKLEIAARRSEFDELTRTLSVPIGGTILGSASG